MAAKYPIEYALTPRNLSAGMRWLALRLRNVGEQNRIGLDVKLNSLDGYDIYVHGTGNFVSALKPGQEETVPFRVLATSSRCVI